eukprot:gnl/Hemi2/5181_TR1803_c0_g1_i1.p2 gnl/Hemi2/5181_TR1803_c0_g1~~gnl/Hemi2/5181_TR1803_c0_g1_i1.p2  ORF type:complete len:284 (-),score=114.78 gnl/Hemi2/5181_TR1803_c0_g1_i1:128-907(-)
MALIVVGDHHGSAETHDREHNTISARNLMSRYVKEWTSDEIHEPARNTLLQALYNLVSIPHRRHLAPHHLALVGHGDHTGAFCLNAVEGRDGQFSADDLLDFFYANPDHNCHRLDIHMFGCDHTDWQNVLRQANLHDQQRNQGRHSTSLPQFTVYIHTEVVRTADPHLRFTRDDATFASDDDSTSMASTDFDDASTIGYPHHPYHLSHRDHLDVHLDRPQYYYGNGDNRRDPRDHRDYDHQDRRGNGYAGVRPYQSYWN